MAIFKWGSESFIVLQVFLNSFEMIITFHQILMAGTFLFLLTSYLNQFSHFPGFHKSDNYQEFYSMWMASTNWLYLNKWIKIKTHACITGIMMRIKSVSQIIQLKYFVSYLPSIVYTYVHYVCTVLLDWTYALSRLTCWLFIPILSNFINIYVARILI
jgi:hypothetical protein